MSNSNGSTRKRSLATPRLACVIVPLFPLAARLRSEPELSREALVVVEGNGSAARVVAASRLARRANVRPGLTLTQARALIPKLVARARDAECERAAQEALLEIADRFSPRVEDAGDGVAYLDIDGIERRFAGHRADTEPSPGPNPALNPAANAEPSPEPSPEIGAEIRLARALLAAAEAGGLPARAGVASSKLAAQVAAAIPDSPHVVPAGQEAAFLAPLPLARLSPLLQASDLAATLTRWGIRTIGELAQLPGARLTSRLGNTGRELHSTARGVDPRPLAPRHPPATFHEGLDLEWPLVALEPFLFVGQAALDRLAQRLEASGLACARLELTLRLEPEGHQLRTIDLPAPTRDVKTLLTLLRLDLEARPPGAPVAGFSLAAHPDRPREAQLSIYGPVALSPDKLAATLARLFAILGPGRVGSPRPVDGHLPERMSLIEYTPPSPPTHARDPRRINGRGLLAIRVLRPPIPIEVLVEEPAAETSTQLAAGHLGMQANAAHSNVTPIRTENLGKNVSQKESAPASATQPAAAACGSSILAIRASPSGLLTDPQATAPQEATAHLTSDDHPESRDRADSPERYQSPERPAISDLPTLGEPSLLPPREIRPLTTDTTAHPRRIAGPIKVASGPWGLEDDWWMPNPIGRDYWDVELTTGGLYRIYRDRAGSTWYADGVYD